MKYFFDTEFCEKPNTIEFISIGIISEDGRNFYAENSEADLSKCNDWVKKNVIPKLTYKNLTPIIKSQSNVVTMCGDTKQIKKELLKFINCNKPEFWAYFADYDWVVFCWIFGSMIDLPEHFPMYCKDLKQLADFLGDPKFRELSDNTEHNALEDAIWNRDYYEFLNDKLKIILGGQNLK